MASFKKILIIGGGGALGPPILNEFLGSPYEVSVLSRKESTATFPTGVKVFKVDYKDFDQLKNAMEGQDVVISNRFFPSEYGPYSRDPKMIEINPYTNPHKAAIVDYLKSKDRDMSWTALITGGFFEWAISNGFYCFDLKSKTVGLVDNGDTVYGIVYVENNRQSHRSVGGTC